MTSAQLADERPRLTFFFPAFNEEENVSGPWSWPSRRSARWSTARWRS